MIVLYTALLGASDSLKRAPEEPDRCVCFTDDIVDVNLRPAQTFEPGMSIRFAGRGWEFRPWNITPDGGRRDARRLRCGSTTLFPKSGLTVWTDASFEVIDFDRLIADFRKLNVDAAALPHHDRTTCYDEGREIIRLGQASEDAIRRQLLEYERDGFVPSMRMTVTTPGMFVRRNTPRVEAFNRLWFEHIERFGDNDLVSIDYCAWKVGLKIGYLEGIYPDNPYVRYDIEDHHARRLAYVPKEAQ